MNEDRLNMEIRKFLKMVGITSQREIETAIREAAAAGEIKPNTALKAKMILTMPELGLTHEIDGLIEID